MKTLNKHTCYYYILKATAKKGSQTYTFYKIGEADNTVRPKDLCAAYTKTEKGLTAKTTQLLMEVLPSNKLKRLNDKTIHKNIDNTIMTKVDRNLICGVFNETDGYNEFFELKDNSVDVVDYIKNLVATLAKDETNFTAKAKDVGIRLNYGTQKHLVKAETLQAIREFGKLNLNREEDKNILLIGQFAPSWVATFAMENNVVIWHDSADQEIIYKDFMELTEHIRYIQNIDELLEGDLKEMKFDLIIANPPYGKTGANITKKIIDNIEFEEYINLLPANDYKRNDSKDLYNYQSDMISINDGFADAAVTTHLAKIHKTKVNDMSLDEFERSNYIDKQLDKYFEENSKRKHYAIDKSISWIYFNGNLENTHTVLLDHRFIANKHLAYSKNTPEYKWNVECSADLAWLEVNCKCPSAPGKLNKFTVTFDTTTEKTNFTKFLYSINGFKFISKIAIGCNGDSTIPLGKILPKVDWSRAWTVEEILADYGYTADEINEVMNDLKNYKGMD